MLLNAYMVKFKCNSERSIEKVLSWSKLLEDIKDLPVDSPLEMGWSNLSYLGMLGKILSGDTSINYPDEYLRVVDIDADKGNNTIRMKVLSIDSNELIEYFRALQAGCYIHNCDIYEIEDNTLHCELYDISCGLYINNYLVGLRCKLGDTEKDFSLSEVFDNLGKFYIFRKNGNVYSGYGTPVEEYPVIQLAQFDLV